MSGCRRGSTRITVTRRRLRTLSARSRESSDTSAVYPGSLTQTAGYNNLNQLTNLSGQALTFDADGNLTSDGLRNYTWDAENRLIGITYPGQAGKATAFSYDGLSRRTAIASTPAGGGSAVTTSYIWCGARICQARNASNAVTREYFAEGEYVPGSPAQPYYYGPDQIGSVRRVFASTSSAPAYSYDPYGNPLQGTAPLTDFNYAGMFYNADSGLYLTQYRAYDPVSGRWLSRDPIDEMSELGSSTTSTSAANTLGLIITLTDSSFQTSYGYAPYGSGSTEDPSEFPRQSTEQQGQNAGTYGNPTRDYDPAWGQMLSGSPTGLREGINTYAYVTENPISNTDALGLCPIQEARWPTLKECAVIIMCWISHTKPPPPPPKPDPYRIEQIRKP
jgi:RHS repeat-associated protein